MSFFYKIGSIICIFPLIHLSNYVSRLIKGDGEVIEEIVSKKRHREINQQATLGDGLYFENKIYKK